MAVDDRGGTPAPYRAAARASRGTVAMNVGYGLVVYSMVDQPVPAAVRDHLYSFRRHSSRRWLYVNLGVRKLPRVLERLPLDAIVIHTSLLGAMRWSSADVAARLVARAQPLKEMPGVRIAIP